MLQEYSGKGGNFFPYLNFTPNPKRLGCFFVSLFFQSNFSPLLDSPHYKFSPHVFGYLIVVCGCSSLCLF
nr:MAG TPA: hypothetical protein [Caudoviricetes sp.]